MRSLRQVVAGWLAPALPWVGSTITGRGTSAEPLDACAVGWQAARGLAAVERCCSLYANGLLLPRSIVDQPASGGQQVVSNTDAARALADLAADDLLVCGYSAALIGFGALRITRNARGGPQSLTFVAPWRCAFEREVNGAQLFVRIARDDALGEPETVVPMTDVIVIRWRPSPLNPLLAESPVNAISPALAGALKTRDTQAALLSAAAVPSAVLETDKELTADQMKGLKRQWDERALLGGTSLLAWGLRFRAIPVASATDLEITQTFRDYISEIGRAWGVPNTLLNEHSDSAYNSAVAASRSFTLHSLMPWLVRAEDEFSRKLLTSAERAAGRRVTFDTEALNNEPGLPKAQYLETLVHAGIISTNEARNQIGYPDREGGDDVRVS